MELIDKAALVAEIERLRKIQPTDEFQPKEQNKIDWFAGKEFAIIALQVFLDTLEVKEVNLKKEYRDYINCDNGHTMLEIAVHFFELGLKASQKGEKV